MYPDNHVTNASDWRERTDQFRALYDRDIRHVPPTPPRPSGGVPAHGLALAGFVFAVIGLLMFPFGIAGVGIGLAVNHTLRRQQRPASGLAAAAWIIGLVDCTLLALTIVFLSTLHPGI